MLGIILVAAICVVSVKYYDVLQSGQFETGLESWVSQHVPLVIFIAIVFVLLVLMSLVWPFIYLYNFYKTSKNGFWMFWKAVLINLIVYIVSASINVGPSMPEVTKVLSNNVSQFK